MSLVLFALTAAILTATVRRLRRVLTQRRAAHAVRHHLTDGIELLVLLLHAGVSPTTAARRLRQDAPAPLRAGWAAVVQGLDRGRPLSEAITVLVDHHGPAVHPVVTGIAAAERDGAPLAPLLERLAADVQASRRREAEARARALSVSMSFPLVVCTLPSFVLLGVVPALAGTLASLRDLRP